MKIGPIDWTPASCTPHLIMTNNRLTFGEIRQHSGRDGGYLEVGAVVHHLLAEENAVQTGGFGDRLLAGVLPGKGGSRALFKGGEGGEDPVPECPYS